jgi:hypothetical protein
MVNAYVCSTTFAPARLPARSCSAVKTCPQVLHRHFEVDLPGPPAPGVPRAFSLGLNAIASSPPHPRHIRFSIIVGFLPTITILHVGVPPNLVRIEQSPGSHDCCIEEHMVRNHGGKNRCDQHEGSGSSEWPHAQSCSTTFNRELWTCSPPSMPPAY